MQWLFAAVPLVLLALGFPIYIIFLASAAVVLLLVMQVPPTVMIQVMFGSLDVQALMAVPFFILAGDLMARGGMAQRLINWFLSMLGGVRGSMGLATVTSCEFFGAMSGSSPATVAAIGQIMYPALLKNNYGLHFSAGLVTASGAIAIIIPPSIALILYGASAQQSIAQLFLAGIVPGIVMGLAMSAYIIYFAIRHKVPKTGQFSFRHFLVASRDALPAMGVPVLILGGIYSGIFSPTEAAGVAAVYAILIAMFFYQDLNFKGLWQVAANSGTITAQILVIVASSGVFAWLLTVSQVPQAITAWIQSIDAPGWSIMLVINLFLLLVGMLIDPTSAILVLTPLLFPIVMAAGYDPIHFGIIFTVNMAIGMFTPPFGLNLFVTQGLFGLKVKQIVPGLIPFIIINFGVLMLITYVPDLSLFVLRLGR